MMIISLPANPKKLRLFCYSLLAPQKELINLLLVTVPKKSIDYFVSSYCPFKKSND
jgi:hypothetical protein